MDGLGTAKQYAEQAVKMGQCALGQTDHGTLSGALHHIKACNEMDILPISGVEAYFRPDRSLRDTKQAWHLCLFAKNLKGWHNLLQIVSTAYGEQEEGGGFYQYPCVDYELLERHSEGIICSTACISSWLSNLIANGDSVAVTDYLNRMRNIYGDDLWAEIMPHDFDDQRILNKELVRVAQEFSIPLIATNDAHFPYKEWSETHRIAKMVGHNKSFLKVEKDQKAGKATYLSELNPTLYLAHEEEMRLWFQKNHPDLSDAVVDEAMENTGLLIQGITPFMLDKSNKLPKVSESPDESEATLRKWIKEGFDQLYNTWRTEDELLGEEARWNKSIYEKRIEEEFVVLKDKGVIDYFVMVGDICRWAKSEGIRVGLGRGSAAGSLISYLVGITAIDPIPYGLLFERFLNPERKGLPDIDLDFDSEYRPAVKQYVADKYGQDHVADIITHQRFQPKNVLQALCRTYDVPYTEALALTKTIDIRQDDEETTLEELLPLNEKLRDFKEKYSEIWEHALRLEGTIANAGKHAAGIIVTPKPITDYMALERGKKGDLVTSWSDSADYAVVSEQGFVKMDFLGITGLTKHEYACKLIEERTGEKPDLNGLKVLRDPYATDDDVMKEFQEGHTVGVFQFGSQGITHLLKEIQPDSIEDLAAANALYRPGPMKGGVTWQYARCKHNPELISYWDDIVEPVLEPTFGLVAYQEQVMEIGKLIGRFTGAEADDMRKAMGKLYRIKGGSAAKDFMGRFEEKWFRGAAGQGIARDTAEEIWQKLLEFGHYGFNKSHSASYALQAYQDMWLKVKYPAEFYAAFLTHEDDEDKIKAAIREAASALGIEIIYPDINRSQEGYTVDENGNLLLGLTSIKGVGKTAAKHILKKRPFINFKHIVSESQGKIPIKELVESGALDGMEAEDCKREWLLKEVPKPLTAKRRKELEETGEEAPWWPIWEHLYHNRKLKNPREVPGESRETPANIKKLRASRLLLPLSFLEMTNDDREVIEANISTPDEIEAMNDGERATVGGEISRVTRKKTKKGKDYANIEVTYDQHQWLVKIWSNRLSHFDSQELLVQGNIVVMSGKKEAWNGMAYITVQEAHNVSELANQMRKEME